MAKAFTAPEGYEPPVITIDNLRDGTYADIEQAYRDRLAELCRRNGTSPLLGEIIRFPVADGAAEYMVWSTSPLHLIWLELGDKWSADPILIRGLRVADVRDRVDRAQKLRAFFASEGR